MSLIKREGSEFWYMRFKFNGKSFLRSTETVDERKAERKEQQFREQLEKEAEFQARLSPEERERLANALKPSPTFKAFVEEPSDSNPEGGLFWSTYATNAYTKINTLRGVLTSIRSLLQYSRLADAKLSAIDDKLVSDYANYRRGTKVKTGTVNLELAYLHVILRQAKLEKFMAAVPEFPERSKAKSPGRAISIAEQLIYLDAVSEPLKTFAMILVSTGLEPTTISELRWEDVELDAVHGAKHGFIHGRCEKVEDRERNRPMSPELQQVLRERFLQQGRPAADRFVFPATRGEGYQKGHVNLTWLRKRHKALWKKSEDRKALPIRFFRFYDLRHTFLTRYAESGASTIEIMHAAGHKNTRQAETYVHPSNASQARTYERYEQFMAEQARMLAAALESPHRRAN